MKRNIIATLIAALAITISAAAQNDKYQLSSHILDITTGRPAAGVTIELSKMSDDGRWIKTDERKTDGNGRVSDLLVTGDGHDNRGIYKLTFHVRPYFEAMSQRSFYPFIDVVFEITDDSHYHVPITLSPYGYSTYRGN